MAVVDYVISARNITGKGSMKKFGNENADCSFLRGNPRSLHLGR